MFPQDILKFLETDASLMVVSQGCMVDDPVFLNRNFPIVSLFLPQREAEQHG